MKNNIGKWIPKLYYGITPAFILIDYIWGVNVRVAVLDDFPLYKGLYYGFCILCGIIIYLIPRSSLLVTLIESITVIFLTVTGLLLPYARILREVSTDVMNTDFEALNVFNHQYIINLCMAGGIATFTFKTNLRKLERNQR